jgi:DNA-binding response OmpR family regulator
MSSPTRAHGPSGSLEHEPGDEKASFVIPVDPEESNDSPQKLARRLAWSASRAEPLRFANIEVRPDEYQVLIGRQRVALTIREFEVLLLLAEHEDRLIPRTRIYEAVWGGEMKYRERAVDVFVRKIRTKLSAIAPEWVYIHTHFGIGYRFSPEERRHGAPPPPDAPPVRRR